MQVEAVRSHMLMVCGSILLNSPTYQSTNKQGYCSIYNASTTETDGKLDLDMTDRFVPPTAYLQNSLIAIFNNGQANVT